MHRLRAFAVNSLRGLSGLTRDFYIAIAISVIIHLLALYCVFAIPSAQPLRMESIMVDFALIQGVERAGEANIKGERRKAKGERRKAKTEGRGTRDEERRTNDEGREQKHEKNPLGVNADSTLSSMYSAADSRQYAVSSINSSINNRADSKQHTTVSRKDLGGKEKDAVSTDMVSLSGVSGHKGYATGYKDGKTGHGPLGSIIGVQGSGSGASGQGGDGKGYDYGYVREAVMKNLKYPEKARKLGWEGKVILSFVINEAGLVRDVKIVKSSGFQTLDEAAKEALTRVTAFQNASNRLVLVHLPVEFRLKQ